MGGPIVVQGTPVTQQQAFGANTAPVYIDNGDRENRKETKCNDPVFAVLFYLALLAIVAVAGIYGPAAITPSNSNSSNTEDNADTNKTKIELEGLIYVAAVIVVLSFAMAGVGMAILMCIPQFIIKVSLIFTVIFSLLMVLLSFATGNIVGGVIGLVVFALTCCYAYYAWSRIPFATANLVTACTAVKSNLGIAFFAYMFAILGGLWSVIWSLAVAGVYDQTCKDQPQTDGSTGSATCSPNYLFIFLLFLSFFFVQQVLQVRSSFSYSMVSYKYTFFPVTPCNGRTPSMFKSLELWRIGYVPGENGCCSKAVCNSFVRTVTTSFGSVCFGSLVVAIIQALKALANQARQNDDCAVFACVAECILGCIAGLVEYFNKWAFVYVGIYGMPYIKAGKSVFELFHNRGWEAIIADGLVDHALVLISLVVGLVMGGIAILIEQAIKVNLGGNETLIIFFLGLVIGFLVTSILMSTIGSAVNAVIVLFAEGPRDFEQNHPELSQKMRQVWNEIYPGSV